MPYDKGKEVMNLFRAEVKYLTACEWILYVGAGSGDNSPPGDFDVDGQVRCWAHPDSPKEIISHRRALAQQKEKDNL